jgi:hypothetical protein
VITELLHTAIMIAAVVLTAKHASYWRKRGVSLAPIQRRIQPKETQ